MPAKKDPAADLAAKLIATLQTQRRVGADAYPLSLRRLAELAEPAAPVELIRAAVKKKSFTAQAIAVQPTDVAAPVALLDDLELLAGSRLLLEYALEAVCTPSSPTIDAAKLKSKVPSKLKPAFDAAVRRRIADQTLPPGVAVVMVKKKPYLHLLRFPLPRPPEETLAAELVRVLKEQKERGTAYPLTLGRLIALAGQGAAPALVKKALAVPAFQETTVLAMKACDAVPLALAGDEALLAASDILLTALLEQGRKADSQALTLAELKKKVVKSLQGPVQDAVLQRVRAGRLPAGVGCLLQKKKPLLFLMSDVRTGATARPEPARTAEPAGDFARIFAAAFAQLDRQAGGHNHVSLVDLRRALAFDRSSFDAGLRQLRLEGRFTLSAAEGRFGLRPEEQEAAIAEDGAWLLYVSRKRS